MISSYKKNVHLLKFNVNHNMYKWLHLINRFSKLDYKGAINLKLLLAFIIFTFLVKNIQQ